MQPVCGMSVHFERGERFELQYIVQFALMSSCNGWRLQRQNRQQYYTLYGAY